MTELKLSLPENSRFQNNKYAEQCTAFASIRADYIEDKMYNQHDCVLFIFEFADQDYIKFVFDIKQAVYLRDYLTTIINTTKQ